MALIRHRIIFSISALSVWFSRMIEAFAPAMAWTGIFFITIFLYTDRLLDLGLLQLIFFLGLIALIWRGIRGFSPPSYKDIENRIFRFNKLPINPYTVLKDTPTRPLSPHQSHLWQKAVDHAANLKSRLWPAPPAPQLSTRDPLRLRYIIPVILVTLTLYQTDTAPNRFKTAFIPAFLQNAEFNKIEAWITMPDYLQRAPIYITEETDLPLNIPAGAIFHARIDNSWLKPRLKTNAQSVDFKENDNTFFLDQKITADDHRLRVLTGLNTRLDLKISVAQDSAPVLSLIETPEITAEKRVQFRYAAQDDHGLENIRITMRPDRMIARRLGQPRPFTQNIPIGGAKFTNQMHTLNMTDHPWAGLPVEMQLTATDTAGQDTETENFTFILPAVSFSHPVAQQLAKLRQDLLWANDVDNYHILADTLSNIMIRPQAFNNDMTVFLGLSSAMHRMKYLNRTSGDTTNDLRSLLWQLALRVEGGSSRVAAENLQNALGQMSQALNNPDLSEEQFDNLRQNLENAMGEYFKSLLNELMAEMPKSTESITIPQELKDRMAQNIQPNRALQDIMDALKNGDRSAIEDAIQKMQEMVDNLKSADIKAMNESAKAQIKNIEALKEIITRQEKLLDKSETTVSRNVIDENRPQTDIAPFADEQQALREDMRPIQKELEDSTGKTAEFMNKADREMKNARDNLLGQKGKAAINAQKKALEHLQKGRSRALDQLAAQMGQALSLPMPGGMRPQQTGPRDPLGRPLNQPTGDVEIPDEEKRRRVREIRDKILDKMQQGTQNPETENYFERLLDRF